VAQAQRIVEELELDDTESGKGQNQEMGLSRPGDTHSGSHYKTVMRVLSLYPSIRKVITRVGKESTRTQLCRQVNNKHTEKKWNHSKQSILSSLHATIMRAQESLQFV
jgi:hypothetical protein